jgi:hypothetical protein
MMIIFCDVQPYNLAETGVSDVSTAAIIRAISTRVHGAASQRLATLGT